MEEEIKKNVFSDEDNYNIGNKLDDFVILKYLGGSISNHYAKVRSKINNKIYAMKIIQINNNLEIYKNTEKILFFVRQFDHPNILKYYSSFIDNKNKNYYIIMEYAENGNLKNYIKIHKILNKHIEEGKINDILYQSMSGLNYLHYYNFLHRNLDISSLYLNEDGIIKIGGFDYLCQIKEKDIKPSKNILYVSSDLSGREADIFTLGCAIYSLRNLIPRYIIIPYKENNMDTYTLKIIKDKLNETQPEYFMLNKNNNGINNINNMCSNIFNSLKYLLSKDYNTSIKCVYFCLKYLLYHININLRQSEQWKIKKEEIENNGPISMSLKDLDLESIRKILLENNKTFNRFGEIDPKQLIKYLIKQIHLEGNKNSSVSQIYTKKYSKNISKKELFEEYNQNYREYFHSVISKKNKGFFGTYEIEDICEGCNKRKYFFESFYFITLDFDVSHTEKIKDLLENYKKEIKVNKYCTECKEIKKHSEFKTILELPYHLVILINNNKNRKLIHTKNFQNCEYCLISTINYNSKKNIYEYSHLRNPTSFIHPAGTKLDPSSINTENVVILFYLYVGK